MKKSEETLRLKDTIKVAVLYIAFAGCSASYRFHRWGVFINRFSKAHSERIQHQVSDHRCRHGQKLVGPLEANDLKEPTSQIGVNHQYFIYSFPFIFQGKQAVFCVISSRWDSRIKNGENWPRECGLCSDELFSGPFLRRQHSRQAVANNSIWGIGES